MKYLLLFLTLFTLSFSDVNVELSQKDVVHGSSFAVIFLSDDKMTQAPFVNFLGKSYQMFTINGNTKKYELFLPVDYHAKKQNENVEVKYLDNDNNWKTKIVQINIVTGEYKQNEIIEVAKGKVTLSDKNKDRTKNEYDEVYSKVYSKVSLYDLTKNTLFSNPINSIVTSEYGTARVYNGVAKSYHSGTDFRASVGEDIKATNNGKVVLVMNRFYLGNVIYIDHGRGAYSYYAHLDESLVSEGEIVKKGQVIAKSGKTGRITGPHLHYAFRLYNVTVDPLGYSKLYNDILKKYHQ